MVGKILARNGLRETRMISLTFEQIHCRSDRCNVKGLRKLIFDV